MNQKFAEAVERQILDVWKAPTSHQAHAIRRALHLLYDSISARSAIAKTTIKAAIVGGNKDQKTVVENAGFIFQVQQTIVFTPLRFFLQVLAEDPSIVIRAAAKGELHDRGVEYHDEQANIMGKANAHVMLDLANERLLKEIEESEKVQLAYRFWQASGLNIPFSPSLVMTINDVPVESHEK